MTALRPAFAPSSAWRSRSGPILLALVFLAGSTTCIYGLNREFAWQPRNDSYIRAADVRPRLSS
jgi:hypothetical protein